MTLRKRLHSHYTHFMRHDTLQVKSYTWEMVLNGRLLSSDTERDQILMVNPEVSWDRELFEAVRFYSEDVLEMADGVVVILERETAKSLLRSPPRAQNFLSW